MKLPLTMTIGWSALCLIGSWWLARGLEADLQQAAKQIIAEQGSAFKNVEPTATGQTLILRGTVKESGADQRLARLLRDRMPLLDAVNTANLSADTRSTGWGLLMADAKTAQLFGSVGSEEESLRVANGLRPLLGNAEVASELDTDPDHFRPVDTPLPALSGDVTSGLLAFARWGEDWKLLNPSLPAETLRQTLASEGLPQQTWDERVGPALQAFQDRLGAQAAAVAERQRLGSLASGHIILAVRADTVLIKGELGNPQAISLLAESVTRFIGERRLLNEVKLNARRRPNADVRKLTQELPVLPSGNLAKLLAVGSPDSGWKLIDLAQLDVEDANSLMPGMLPSDLDRRLVIGDAMSAAIWVQSIFGQPSGDEIKKAPAHLFLAIAGLQVFVRGRVPDEPIRTLVESAVRKRYPHLESDISVRVDPDCLGSDQYIQTLGLLPPAPALDTSGIIAFATLGSPWSVKPARASLLDAATLVSAGVIPADFPINSVLPDIIAIAPALRTHFKAQQSAVPPGIPLQTIGPR